VATDMVPRRLSAILAADVVGYSRLIRADEEGTLAALSALRRDLIDPRIAAHHGRIVKLMGDGMLAEFSSVVNAVRFAVEVQQAVAGRNAEPRQEQRIEFRVGINLGDVVIDGDDIHGDGVNVAARLEGIAEPGGICISGSVHEQVRDRLDLAFTDMGEQTVKNIDRPVQVWRWADVATAPMVSLPEARNPTAPRDKPSIAVLPFDNMSGDSELEFFADGLAEDILTMLSKVSALFVIARNSTFAYKGQAPDVRRVGEELGVRYALEGSVRKGGDRLRITGQLIDSRDGSHVWAETYNRTIADVFDLQDDITKEIVTALRVQLTDGEAAQVWSRGTDNIEAWKCMIQAVETILRFSAGDNAEARKLAERAAGIDPGYAMAWAVVGTTYWYEARIAFAEGEEERLIAKAEECAVKALALDDTDSWTLVLNSAVFLSRGRHDEAVASARRGIERHPGSAQLRSFLGFCLLPAGQPEEALKLFDDAIRLDPLHPTWYLPVMARAHDAAGDPEKAIELAEESLAREHNNFPALLHLTSLYARAGRDAEARDAATDVLRLAPNFTVALAGKWLQTRDETFAAIFAEGLRKAGLPK